MLINQNLAISTSRVLLVPYESHHVEHYHEWMKDPAIQEATASEPLSLEEEHAMQRSWRTDNDKLTFIICQPLPPSPQDERGVDRNAPSPEEISRHDRRENMIGDVNLFLYPSEEDSEEGCIGELELMIASSYARRKGYGRAAILAFMMFVNQHLREILEEYRAGLDVDGAGSNGTGGDGLKSGKMNLLQLKVKVGSRNEASIGLFESLAFLRVGEGPNYFGEVELVLEGFLGLERMLQLLDKWGVEDWCEVKYSSPC